MPSQVIMCGIYCSARNPEYRLRQHEQHADEFREAVPGIVPLDMHNPYADVDWRAWVW